MISALVLLTGGLLLFYLGTRYQKFRHNLRQRVRRWPIEGVKIEEIAPQFFPRGAWGPPASSQISFVPCVKTHGGISDYETWILCNFAKHSRRIFELGTCTGKTTHALATNSPADTEIVTLTLHPGDLPSYQHRGDDRFDAWEDALRESCYTDFYYTGTPEESKIVQLFGDSKEFDESLYFEDFDLIFIDGSHAYSYVLSDTEKALRMLRPGGHLFWHDYRGPREARDVFRALNGLRAGLLLRHIMGTSLVFHTKPPIGSLEGQT